LVGWLPLIAAVMQLLQLLEADPNSTRSTRWISEVTFSLMLIDAASE
jgi:hypothetical protein